MNNENMINRYNTKVVITLWCGLLLAITIYFLTVMRTCEHTIPYVHTDVMQWSADSTKWDGGWK